MTPEGDQGDTNWKGRSQSNIFAGETTVYRSEPKYSTRELLQLSTFSKVSGCKINSWESVALYSNDKWTEKEIRDRTPFTVGSKNINYLGLTLSKQVKDSYDKNFKTLKKETEEDIRRWKDPHAHGFMKCKWPSYQKQSTDSRQSSSRFHYNSSQKLKTISSFIWKDNMCKTIAKTIWNNKRSAGCIIIPDFRLYWRASIVLAQKQIC